MDLPKKINPCPILEAIVEIRFDRFDNNMPHDAIFGVIYNEFKNDFKNNEKLPILQLPDSIRMNDQNLLYKPYYQLIDDLFAFQIGPRVISFSNRTDYIGWKAFSKKINDSLQRIMPLKIIGQIKRVGIRYVNLFDLNIYDNLNLTIQTNNRTLNNQEMFIQTIFQTGKFQSNLQVSNNARITNKNGEKKGSIVDIDTFLQENGFKLENIMNLIEQCHEEEKKLFFSLLQKEYLAQLNPEY